jgi:diguanylate cyclase (GGDEF)-like protein
VPEWDALVGEATPGPDPAVALVAPDEEAKPGMLPPAVDVSIEIVPRIIRWLKIGEERESIFARLDAMMDHIPGWLRFTTARLVILEERLGGRESEGTYVMTVPEEEVLKHSIYERCRRTRESEVLSIEAARALGVPDPVFHNSFTPTNLSGYQVAVCAIYALGELWGILEMWVDPAHHGAMLDDRIEIGARIVEQTIENAINLENLTSIDVQTGIYNRAFYESQGPIEIERATRLGSKLSMLVVDIDDFKAINDTHGHLKGDDALACLADLLKGNLRKIDLPFRYGGEEFVVLLPGTPELEAQHTAERLRVVVSEQGVFTDDEGNSKRFTISIGGAMFPDHGRSLKELFKMADTALLRAKRLGKNRVEFHE